MSLMEKPAVNSITGGKYWEHIYDKFRLKVYVPDTDIDGEANNYGFRAPLLLIFEEKPQTVEEAVAFARSSGLADIASAVDSSVLFVYPTCEGGWKNADESLYADLIAETRINPVYEDGLAPVTDFFKREFKGYYIRGAIFRADIYSFGESADYVATHLLKKIDGEYLWGPGEITPAMCSMERLSVIPAPERTDIGILSVGNSDEVNAAFKNCSNLLIRDKADYSSDFRSFVRKFKMWCGTMNYEPDFDELGMTEEAGCTIVRTSPYNHGRYKDTKEHKAGYFAYYNKGIFDNGPVPLLVGFHGGGDSSMFLTFVSGWWEVCHKYGFLYVSLENHQDLPADEAIQVIDHLKEKYRVDEHRIYATGFSMGSGKTWDMFQEFPETFAGVAPGCALFPVKDNPFARPMGDWLNTTVPVPIFYSGGEQSPLPELPCQAETTIERMKYLAQVNKLKKKFDLDFADKDNWEDKFYGIPGDRTEKLRDESRDAVLTVRYYDSEDGVCRTALGSIDNQQHEYRHHTGEQAWKFISQFTR